MMITVPSHYDVLLGRGKGYFNHVGNLRYHSLIQDYQQDYEQASKRQGKLVIAQYIIDTILQTNGGRFLKDEDGIWIMIHDNTVLLKKVAHSFRALRESGGGGPSSTSTNNHEEHLNSDSSGNNNNSSGGTKKRSLFIKSTVEMTAPVSKQIIRM